MRDFCVEVTYWVAAEDEDEARAHVTPLLDGHMAEIEDVYEDGP